MDACSVASSVSDSQPTIFQCLSDELYKVLILAISILILSAKT